MTRYFFDTETNGFLEQTDVMHSLVLKDLDTGELHSFANPHSTDSGYRGGDEAIRAGLDLLTAATEIWAHNAIKFDLPVIRKVYPAWTTKAKVRCTLVTSRLLWPGIRNQDVARQRKPSGAGFPRQMIGRHSLAAWGHRLGEYKDDYKGGFDEWSPEMQSYCEQDVEVGVKLWELIQSKSPPETSLELEHRFQEVIFLQEQHGWHFDRDAATRLYAKLAGRRTELEQELQEIFPPWEVRTPFTPKVNNKTRGYVKGVTVDKVKVVTFNPASRDHIANRLTAIHGWKPAEFTVEGKPKVDEDVLVHLPYPEAKTLNEYLLVGKRIGQLAEGKQALLKVEKDGRIHGTVMTNGAVTGRCTHSKPNVAQVPRVRTPYGKEMRSLFVVPEGYKLVGADASGIELRMLAHFMARYDGGKFAKVLLEGDIHEANRIAAGLDERDDAKTFIYAYLYGAGDEKLGTIAGVTAAEIEAFKQHPDEWRRVARMVKKQGRIQTALLIATILKGRQLRARFQKSWPAITRLKNDIKEKVKATRTMRGIDGRTLYIRSQHSALNMLLQSAAGLLVKQASVFLYDDLSTRGWVWDKDWAQVAHIHDELQLKVREDLADDAGSAATAAILRAGEFYNFRLPTPGEYKVGRSWAETH